MTATSLEPSYSHVFGTYIPTVKPISMCSTNAELLSMYISISHTHGNGIFENYISYAANTETTESSKMPPND